MSAPVQRLEITLKQPNPIFEKWLERWLRDAEKRNAKSQYKLREALQALRSYPLPLSSGRECAVLRGFGTTLCNLIDEELSLLKQVQPKYSIDATETYQTEVQEVIDTVKNKVSELNTAINKPKKLTKKLQKELEDEQRQIQVTMSSESFEVLMLVDIQETSGKNKRTLDQTQTYLEALNTSFEVRRLTVGDFLWIARDSAGNELVLPYIVERKRMDDLASSIRDGRFHEQKHRLRKCGIQNVIYLVENYGNNEHLGLPIESLQQAIANTHVQSGFTVVHTENHWRSMVYLQGLTKTLVHLYRNKVLIGTVKEDLQPSKPQDKFVGLLKFRDLYEDSARNSLLTVREIFVQQLLQLHSLSMDKVLAIVEQFPTPRKLLDAYDACDSEEQARLLLATIRCGKLQRQIGGKLSQTIYDFYKTIF